MHVQKALPSDWQSLVGDIDDAFDGLAEQNIKWLAYLDTLACENLLGEFDCFHANGEPFSQRPLRSNTLLHIFNHGTHHR